jgi:hypothetical protein
MWYRIFAPTRQEAPLSVLVEMLHQRGCPVVPHFKGDDLGWTSGEFQLPAGGTPLLLARYLTKEDDLRADLNSFAAELETMTFSPNAAPLMERVIQTQQLVTIRKPLDTPNDSAAETACEATCQILAGLSGGFYQVDGQGWFEASGAELLHEY